MINVNLLPGKPRRKKVNWRRMGVYVGAAVGVMVLLVVANEIYASLTAQQEKVRRLKASIASMENQLRVEPDVKRQEEAFKTQFALSNEIVGTLKAYELLGELIAVVYPPGLVTSTLEYGKNGIKLTVTAPDDRTMSDFLDRINKSKSFQVKSLSPYSRTEVTIPAPPPLVQPKPGQPAPPPQPPTKKKVVQMSLELVIKPRKQGGGS